jgi:DNA polymerase-3 subunit alpha (Gram-positive type)
MREFGKYVVLDLETTGLSRHQHKITEIAAVKVYNGEIIDEFQTLVNPGCMIPPFITKLTGITNEMVRYQPSINKILPHFMEFLEDCPIVAHNASFDYGFIDHNSQKHLGMPLTNEKLCTKKLATRLVPELPSKRLAALCDYFEIINEQAHRAMADVKATHKVLIQFFEMLDDMGYKTKKDVLKFENTPPSKILKNF